MDMTNPDCKKPLGNKNTSVPLYSVSFYFGRNEEVPVDNLPELLAAATNRLCFKQFVQDNVVGVPEIVNINLKQQVPTEVPNYLNEDSIADFQGYSWIFIDDVKLTSNGIVYLTINEQGKNSTVDSPTATQIKYGYTINNQKALGYTRSIFLSNILDNQINATFYPLKSNTSYQFNLVFTNENPFNSDTYSTVKSR